MMSEKAKLFGDEAARRRIMTSAYPKAQKEAGRGVRGYDDAVWTAARYDIVIAGTIEKYRQNEDLRKLLLATGHAEIVEASPDDDIWGIGMAEDDPHVLERELWGLNLLGQAIQKARDVLSP